MSEMNDWIRAQAGRLEEQDEADDEERAAEEWNQRKADRGDNRAEGVYYSINADEHGPDLALPRSMNDVLRDEVHYRRGTGGGMFEVVPSG